MFDVLSLLFLSSGALAAMAGTALTKSEAMQEEPADMWSVVGPKKPSAEQSLIDRSGSHFGPKGALHTSARCSNSFPLGFPALQGLRADSLSYCSALSHPLQPQIAEQIKLSSEFLGLVHQGLL